jgi:hypothetical protein
MVDRQDHQDLYNRRSLVETTMCRDNTIVGRRLHAPILPNQRAEAKIGCNVLNRMGALGMPASTRIRVPSREKRPTFHSCTKVVRRSDLALHIHRRATSIQKTESNSVP